MAMKAFIIIVIVSFIVSCKMSNTEYFQITSLEGKNVKIFLEPDYVNNLLYIKLDSGDKMYISGFRGLINPIQIHKNFLILPVQIIGGSGIARQYTVIICVSNDKIYKSLHVISLDEYTNHLGKVEYNYTISTVEIKQKNKTFLLSFEENIFDMGKQSNSYHTLHFDRKLKIFYSKMMPLDGLFTIDSDCGNVKKEVLFKKDNVFPVVEITDNYYFINGLWHIHVIDGSVNNRHLTGFSNQCE